MSQIETLALIADWIVLLTHLLSFMCLSRPVSVRVSIVVLSVRWLTRSTIPLPFFAAVLAQGLQFAYDIGAHRRGFLRAKNVVLQEDLRRAFWVLYVQEKELSAATGRPSMVSPFPTSTPSTIAF